MGFNIVLIEPEIPNNTGNIGRLALGTGSTLHLVKPFGFELTDKRLKRAGLDYWQHLNVIMYKNVDAFFKEHQNKKMIFFSAAATKNHWEIDFEDEMFLVFGKESVGLPKSLLKNNMENAVKIPLYSEHIRSLNLANAVAISIYEGLRQIQ
ncbi:tRNA (cytidine(34)-2'-O)-methyltransferase [Maribacter litoralis]|uniref:Putative tRNA (cytidine(34)-2'-O)-methyltransferase n=1 Tax=Maribacter litoralis TaxID=2059726 RepID=A0A653N8R4_9FLAO|nr:tRNA (cytidine(34)-2'-O)-methyltransferase [Maribacter litoralis]VXB13797.1 putative tRNA (cytidine(34)-2'-O)-methyltransferase [Maribacter litoralis]